MNGEDLQKQMAEAQEIERLKRSLMTRILTKEAFERLSRIRTVNPNMAAQVELYLIQVYQTGNIKDLITDTKMKEILQALTEAKSTSIKRI
ncbi:MAG: DNA-binding protein [Candidatus Aenigmatarchaeota archaeon]